MSCLVLKLWMRTLNSPFIIFFGSHWRRILCDTSPPLFAIFRHPSLPPKPLHARHLPVTAIQWGSFSPLVALSALFVSPPSLHYINTCFVHNCPLRTKAKANPFIQPPPHPQPAALPCLNHHTWMLLFLWTHTSCACGAARHSPQSWRGCSGTCSAQGNHAHVGVYVDMNWNHFTCFSIMSGWSRTSEAWTEWLLSTTRGFKLLLSSLECIVAMRSFTNCSLHLLMVLLFLVCCECVQFSLPFITLQSPTRPLSSSPPPPYLLGLMCCWAPLCISLPITELVCVCCVSVGIGTPSFSH